MAQADTSSEKKNKFSLNSMQFDDAAKRTSRRTLDKAAPIRDILQTFTLFCGRECSY